MSIKPGILDSLNTEQRQAAAAPDGPVMIVAGAGSGKTRVLTHRIAYLIHSGVPSGSILALTFTNKAAREMKSRIVSLLGEPGKDVRAGTFHSMFARLFRNECSHFGYRPSFTIYDSDDSLALVRMVMGSLRISSQEFSPKAVRSAISFAKNNLIAVREFKESADTPFAEIAGAVYERYERQLRKSNALDFDDLLLKPLELFRKNKDVLTRTQFRFRHILVDEYQDTNRVQYGLLKLLSASHGNICVVGDDAQSIYSFRGADIRNMLEFESDFGSCRVFRLEQNYRSTGTILSAANSLIQKNRGQITKSLWTRNNPGESVVVVRCSDDRDEGYRIVETIEEELRKQKRDLRDFVVLYRTNAQSRAIEDALRRNGIPYSLVGSVAFYKRKEIKDVLAYLSVVANRSDDQSLLRILNVPPRGIGTATIRKLSAFAEQEEVPLFEAMTSSKLDSQLQARSRQRLRELAGMIRKYDGLKGEMSLSELARAIVDETGILVSLKEESTPESLARRENVQELVSALTEFSDNYPEARLEEFLEEVSLVSDVDEADFGRNAVTLMTLHSAKGLEYPVVFVAGLEEGLFPLAASLEKQEDLEEERRLMYVGMTRAREQLYLTHASTRYRFGQLSYMVRSRFIDEIDGTFLRTDSQPDAVRRTGSVQGGPMRREQQRRKLTTTTRSDEPDPFPAYEDESQLPDELRVGLRVTHVSFGSGRIVALDGNGENARAVVNFDRFGRKHLLLKYAHLKTG